MPIEIILRPSGAPTMANVLGQLDAIAAEMTDIRRTETTQEEGLTMSDNKAEVLELMKEWGYLLRDRPHPASPGYAELLVALRPEPTGVHFDPKTLQLVLHDEELQIARRTTLSLDPLTREMLRPGRVCPGLVVIGDHLGKRVEFFTFGGTLDVVEGEEERGEVVVCVVRSPVPLLRMTELPEEEAVAGRLGAEIEALMGELRARWGTDDEEYCRRLTQSDPFDFYVSSLHSLLERYDDHPVLQQEDPALYNLLLDEKQWLERKGRWPKGPVTLEGLLAPE